MTKILDVSNLPCPVCKSVPRMITAIYDVNTLTNLPDDPISKVAPVTAGEISFFSIICYRWHSWIHNPQHPPAPPQ